MSPSTTATRPRPSTSGATGRDSLSEQLAQRQRQRRQLRFAIVAVLVLALLVTAAWLVYASSMFATRTVAVDGAKDLADQQVVQVAAVPLGLPLARQDLDAIAQRATTLPEVSRARVTRDWPNTLTVHVTEREPLLAVPQPGGFLIVDAEGVGFRNVESVPAGVVETQVNSDDRALLVELGAVALALPTSVRDDIETIAAVSRDNIVLRLDSGLEVRWGDASDSTLKGEVVTALLKRKPKTSIDVSSPHNPATR